MRRPKGKQRSFVHYEASLLFLSLSLFVLKWHMGFACLRSPTLATPNLYRLVPGSLGFRFTGGVCKVSHQHTLKAKRTTQPKTRLYQLLSQQSHLLPTLFIPKDYKLQTSLSLKDFNQKVLVCYSNMLQ